MFKEEVCANMTDWLWAHQPAVWSTSWKCILPYYNDYIANTGLLFVLLHEYKNSMTSWILMYVEAEVLWRFTAQEKCALVLTGLYYKYIYIYTYIYTYLRGINLFGSVRTMVFKSRFGRVQLGKRNTEHKIASFLEKQLFTEWTMGLRFLNK